MNITKILSPCALITFMLIGGQCWSAAETRFDQLTQEKFDDIVEQLLAYYDSEMQQNQNNHANTVIAELQARDARRLSENEKQALRENRIGVYLTGKQNKAILDKFICAVEPLSPRETKAILAEVNQRLQAKYPWESYPVTIVTNQN